MKSLFYMCPCRILHGKCLVENVFRNIAEESFKQEVVRRKWVVIFVNTSHVGEWTRVDKTLGFADDRCKDIWVEFRGNEVQEKSTFDTLNESLPHPTRGEEQKGVELPFDRLVQ